MDIRQRSELIGAIENAFAEVGITDMYSGAKRLNHWLDGHRDFIDVSQSREKLDAFFTDCGEDDPEVQQYIALCLAFPGIAKAFVQTSLVEAAKTIPIPSGRPSSLSFDTKRKIVAKVGALYTNQRVLIGVAQSRAAMEFGISKRTVQQVWNRREEIAERPFQSMQDVWQFLTKD